MKTILGLISRTATWLLMWIWQADKWLPCSSCSPNCAHKPGALRLCSLLFVTCCTFFLLEAHHCLLLVQTIVLSAKCSSSLLLPKDAQAVHLPSPCYVALYSATLGLWVLPVRFLTTSHMKKLCQDSRLALSVPLQLVKPCICTHSRGSLSYTICKVQSDCRALCTVLLSLKYQHAHYRLARTKDPDRCHSACMQHRHWKVAKLDAIAELQFCTAHRRWRIQSARGPWLSLASLLNSY